MVRVCKHLSFVKTIDKRGTLMDTYIVLTEYVKAFDKVNQIHFG
jgi:hypothetical protein